MAGRSKGFDPLSNLFEPPAPVPARTQPSVRVPIAADPSDVDDTAGASVQTAPADAGVDKAALARALAEEAKVKAAAEAAEKAALARRVAEEAKAKMEAEALEKRALAKKLAEEAKAKVDAEAADKAALAKKLAEEAKAKIANQPAPDVDKEQLAKTLAKAAQVKAAQRAAAIADRAPKSLSDRAGRRPMTALEAARAAAAEEESRRSRAEKPAAEARPVGAARAGESSAPAREASVPACLSTILNGVGSVEGVYVAAQRPVLTALWKAHRARHQGDGSLVLAASCAAVVDALDRVDADALQAALVTQGSGDFLVWMDVGRNAVLAAIPDGRAYLVGLSG